MRLVLVLTVAGVLLCGCAIGVESSAHVIDHQLVPQGLMAPASTSPAPGLAIPTDNVTLYLVLGQDLVAVDRAARSPVSLSTVLRELTRGPTTSEQVKGVQSPLSTTGRLTLRSLVKGDASVDLRDDFTNLGGHDQILAAAQLVYTVTAFPGVDHVTFLVNGQVAAVPTATGSLSSGPLRRADYSALAPR
jgi:spore germination protein GerM